MWCNGYMDTTENFVEMEYLSPKEKQLRQRQKACKHISWKCSQCSLYKDNLRVQNELIEKCLLIVLNNPKQEAVGKMTDMLRHS